MKKRYWLMGTLAVVLMLAAMIPAVALASRPNSITVAVENLTVTSAGEINVRQAGFHIVISTTGEETASTLNCKGDSVCEAAGLNGAPMTSTHNSLVRLTATGPGTFSLAGHLQGTILIAGLPGTFQASISGTASCYPTPAACSTFLIDITDVGTWNLPGIQGKGAMTLSISGIVGVALDGFGSLDGTVHGPH